MDLRMRGRIISVVLVFFSFSYPFLINPWGEAYYYTNMKAYYLIGFSILLCAFIWSTGERQKKRMMRIESFGLAVGLLLFFLLLVGFSTILSLQKSFVGYLTQHYGILVMLSYALLFFSASRFFHPDSHKKIIIYMTISSSLCAVYGIAQHYGVKLLPQDFILSYVYKNRSFSFFDNPDYFGAYLVLAVVMVFALYLGANTRLEEVFCLFILCLLGIALLGSETRSAWLGSLVGLITLSGLVAWKRRDLWRKWIVLSTLILLIFVVMNLFSEQDYLTRAKTIVEDAQRILTDVDSNKAGATRWYIWKITLPLIPEHFWFGSGPNTFQLVFHPGIDSDFFKYLKSGSIYDANNDYLQIALTLGVPALFVYLLFIGVVCYSGFRAARTLSGEKQILAFGCLAAITGYLVQAFFNVSVVSVAPYFWLLLGFVYSHSVNKGKGE